MSKSQEIESIIAQRVPLAQKLAELETPFKSLYGSIQELERQRYKQLEYWTEYSATQSKLQNLNFAHFEQKAQEGLESLRRLQGRFSRKTLNIGVIGRMGQGKSTLLQSLSGLGDDVIPALQGKACTAARSTICHQEGDITTAEIQFHDKESFLREVIVPYYQKLELAPVPSSFEAFANTEIPSLRKEADQTQINIYNRLKDDYHVNAKQYQEYLGRGYLSIGDKSKISNYVAQKYDADSQLINYECLAVKHVKISCSFPQDEVGAIALVDVPGLGDFRLGDESLVIEALGQEVDFILFMRKPSKDRANFEQSDTQLYDLANKALNDLPSRSIFVLNVDKNRENEDGCRSLKRDLDSATVKMPVLGCTIADCSSPEEANTKVLQAVLDNLRSNVTELDRNYATRKIADLQESMSELYQQLELAKEALPEIDDDEISDKYDDLFDDFWNTIANEMTELQKELIGSRDDPDENLKKQIDIVLEECRKNVEMPSDREIEKRRNKSNSYAIAYSECLEELRTSLSSRFLDLDQGLKKSIEEAKIKVVDVLVEKCSLGGLTEARGADFLTEVVGQIPAEYTELKKGFKILSEFNLSYRGLIQHRIRLQLDRLTPDKTARLKAGANAQDILGALNELYRETIYNCEDALKGFLSDPSQASFAIVEEFADRVLRAKSAKKEWNRFLRRKRDRIWGDFEQLQKQIDAIREWSRLLISAESQIENLEGFLNKL